MKRNDLWIHLILWVLAFLTLVPFVFVVNNSFRTNTEMYHGFFGMPRNFERILGNTGYLLTGRSEYIHYLETPVDDSGRPTGEQARAVRSGYGDSFRHEWDEAFAGYRYAWRVLRQYMLNSFLVSGLTALGTVLVGSVSAYIFSRYRFPGYRILFYLVISTMMIPGVLTLVPSFLVVKNLGLLDSYWVLILPYVAGGQVFAIFVFRSFFAGIPEDLFEAARIDGAGHLRQYWHVVLPLSKPVLAVVAIMNILGTWNNFLWPYIVNHNEKLHVVASGLYLMSSTQVASNFRTMYSAYILSSIPLLLLFIFATKPFLRGVTSGAFKA